MRVLKSVVAQVRQYRHTAGGTVGGHAQHHATARHPDGFDDPAMPESAELLTGCCIPPAIRRADGIPVSFEPDEARFLADELP